jgi:uncharacterized membrane protein YtjA (UPF0391 family)
MGCIYVCHGFPGAARAIVAIARLVFLIQIILFAVLFHYRGNFLQIFGIVLSVEIFAVLYQWFTRIFLFTRNKSSPPMI